MVVFICEMIYALNLGPPLGYKPMQSLAVINFVVSFDICRLTCFSLLRCLHALYMSSSYENNKINLFMYMSTQLIRLVYAHDYSMARMRNNL